MAFCFKKCVIKDIFTEIRTDENKYFTIIVNILPNLV